VRSAALMASLLTLASACAPNPPPAPRNPITEDFQRTFRSSRACQAEIRRRTAIARTVISLRVVEATPDTLRTESGGAIVRLVENSRCDGATLSYAVTHEPVMPVH